MAELDRVRRLLASMPEGAARRFVRVMWQALPVALPTAALAWFSLRAVFEKAGGVALPLDDSYIHFQFARSFACGTPLVYSPDAAPVPGATSLLWPALLSVGYWLGLKGPALAWEAWLLGFVSLGLLAHEARRACEGLTRPLVGWGAAFLVLGFGANTWFAASGMEVVPLAWLLLRSVRRAAEWCEANAENPGPRLTELLALAVLAPLMRPEGAVAAVLIAAALLWRPGRTRWWSLLAFASIPLPGVINWLLTAQFASTTAQSKWLLLSPYTTRASLWAALVNFAHTLFGTLINGEVWSAIFLPKGSAPVALAALFALPIAGILRGKSVRAVLLLVLALAILLPGTYECPLCNRLRYLWPFVPAWFVGLAAASELIGGFVERRVPVLSGLAPLLIGGCAGGVVSYLPFAIDDVAASANAIQQQQVSLARWATTALPAESRIGVNDTGALTYLSGRRTFDVVGLTTSGESKYWTSGPGSRFEHYERLGQQRLPTHFIVYPEWFAIESVLGEELTERDVPNATILGGRRMVAYQADWSLLGSAEVPSPLTTDAAFPLLDQLDVADLESEQEHAFALNGAAQGENVVVHVGERAEGARSGRTVDEFRLKLQHGGKLVLRVAAELPVHLQVEVGKFVLPVLAMPTAWEELSVQLPEELPDGTHTLRVRSNGGSFTSLHYFSLGRPR